MVDWRHRLRSGLISLVTIVLTGCQPADGDGIDRANSPAAACPSLAGANIRWIVPFSPGGGYDVYARLMEPYLEDALDAGIVVRNRVGAGGRVGARAIRDAEPDGRTLGIVNATSLLVSELSDQMSGLHPFEDFTPIGRIGYADPVWAAAPGSEFTDVEALLSRSDREPILFGITDVGSTGFVSVSVAAEILGLDLLYLPGYPGSRETSLGLIRGEFDLGGFTLESILDRVEAGDLQPVLQVADAPFSDHPSVRDVPILAGPEGLVARTFQGSAPDSARAVALANAVVGMFQAGRLVVAPAGLDPEIAACLSRALETIANDPDFLQAAAITRRTIAFEGPTTLTERIRATGSDRSALAPILRNHIQRARGGSSR